MAAFQFSVLAMIDHFRVDLLEDYKKIGVKEIHYDIIDDDFYAGHGYEGEWIQEMHQLGLKINVHIMAREIDGLLAKIPPKRLESISFQIEPFDAKQIIDNLRKIEQNIPVSLKGIAVQFDTPIDKIDEQVLKQIDFITLMSVKPGKGGQAFNDQVIDNLKKIKLINRKLNKKILVHLDGGVNAEVVKKTPSLVDSYVSGSYFFKLDLAKKIDFLKLVATI